MKSLEHDFKNYPELTNRQMDLFYLESPHKQIGEDFWAKVVKVIDGDTIRVTMDERDFDFPVRFLGTAAPEKNESGGIESLKWLSNQILGEEVLIQIDKKERVGKWGRLLGTIIHKGMNINEESIRNGMAIPFDQIEESEIPNFLEKLEVIK
tara:strand:- start:369 stop:824 length:456 start_codon:yes stop_codon:yes gene_type:complete